MNDVEKVDVVGKYLEVRNVNQIIIEETNNTLCEVQRRLLDCGVIWVMGEQYCILYEDIGCYSIGVDEYKGVNRLLMTYYMVGDEYVLDGSTLELTINEFEGLLVDGYKSVISCGYDYAMGVI